MANTLRWAIGGCPRSGTTWTAKVLSAGGMDTGHERIAADSYRILGEPALLDRGESSFATVPAFSKLRRQGTMTVQLVRAPLDGIASMWARGISLEAGAVADLARRHIPSIYAYSGVRRVAAYWCEWNLLGWGKADLVWRIHQTSRRDFEELADRVGVPFEWRDTPVDVGHNRPAVTKDMLGPELWHRVAHLSDVFGVPMRHDPVLTGPVPPVTGPQVVRVNPAKG